MKLSDYKEELIEELSIIENFYLNENSLYCSIVGGECFPQNECPLCILERIRSFIEAQPTSDGWIPCGERLPEISGKYLCSYGDGYVGTFCFTTNLYLLAPLNFNRHKYNERKGFYECDSMYGYYEIENVTAWQPLPQPYKEGEE